MTEVCLGKKKVLMEEWMICTNSIGVKDKATMVVKLQEQERNPVLEVPPALCLLFHLQLSVPAVGFIRVETSRL